MTLRPLPPALGVALGVVGATAALTRPLPAQATPSAPGAVSTPRPAAATGRITGRVLDAKSGEPLAGVGVQVVGTTLGAMSGVDGRYSVGGVPAGSVSIVVRRIGFQPKTVSGIAVASGRTAEQDVTLAPATVQLQAVAVTAAAERGTVNQALDQQRTATGVVNAITVEQIARSPDADAAQAVQRVSGVTVQDGRYVFVRGLGERYTTTSLNGARMPSPEPERKVVPLDLFPSGLIQSITTSKTFTPDLQGDFSGAQVDIRTREFPARRQFTFSSTLGYNGAAGRGTLWGAPGTGGEAFALTGRRRELPALVRAAGDLTTVSQGDKNRIIGSFRDVWSATPQSQRPNGSFAASLGGNDPLFGHRVGYLLSGTYSNAQEVRDGEERAVALPVDGSTQRPINAFQGRSGRSSVLLGGLANFGTLIGTRTRVAFNNTLTRTADNDARVETGISEELGFPVQITRLDYIQRSVFSSQLQGEHDLGRSRLEWSGTASGVRREQPDRSESAYEVPQGGAANQPLRWVNTIPEAAVRVFAELREASQEGKLDYRYQLGTSARPVNVKLGGLARKTDRFSDVRQFGIFARALSDDARTQAPEAIFSGSYTADTSRVLDIRSLAQGGSYAASDVLNAGYAMVDAPLGSRWQVVSGARVERSQVRVSATSTLGQPFDSRRFFTDALPSLALTFRSSERMNLRLSAARTLARPEYRELAGIRTREVLGGVDTRGNPELVRTLIDNADVRWELYPNAGEVLSVGVFAKRFQNPIERVFRPSNTNSLLTFVNAEGADNLGVELEARKGLGFLSPFFAPITAFTNLTVMRSEIRLSATETALTNRNRPMTGQSPYVVNSGLTYTARDGRRSATVLYNRVGERISAAGESPLPDVYELPRNVVDVSLRTPIGRGVALRVDARNLTDARYQWRQGSVVREAFRAGRIFQAGFSWQP